MFKIIDKYIIGKYLGSFIFMLSILSIIVVVIDISQKLQKITDNGSSIAEALIDFYPYWTLWVAVTFAPVAIFVSVIYFTSRITDDTEIVAMQASGISYHRISWAYGKAALFLVVIIFFINHFLLPFSNVYKNEYEYKYLLGNKQKAEYNADKRIAGQLSDSSYIFVSAYNQSEKIGRYFLYQVYDKNNKLKKNISANNFSWDEENKTYILNRYYERIVTKESDSIKNGEEMEIKLNITPEELLPAAYVSENMNSIALIKFIQKEKEKGSANVNTFLLELHRRTSIAITVFILTMLAVSISSRKIRGGTGLNLAIGISLSFIYILIIESARIFTNKDLISPFLAAWLGNIIFGLVTIYLYYKRANN